MKKETLMDAVGHVDDSLIDTAAQSEKRRGGRHWKRWTALAACLALVVTGIALFPRMGVNSSETPGMGANGNYSYKGPILPLTIDGNGEGVSAEREITLDFSNSPSRVDVTDCYTLRSESEEPITVKLCYPFAGQLRELDRQRPELRIDGQAADAVLRVAASGQEGLEHWEDYEKLLADEVYLAGEHANLSDISVIVYRFDDPWGPEESNEIPNPTIRAEFTLDFKKTAVLSYGFHGGRNDLEAGEMGRSFSIPRPIEAGYGESRYLIVLGEDIGNLTVKGYATGGWTTTQSVESGVDVARYESDLGTVLRDISDLMYQAQSDSEKEGNGEREAWYALLCDAIAGQDTESIYNQEGMLEERGFAYADQLFWVETEVTIPAGGTVTLSFRMEKAGSCYTYNGGRDNGSWAYELATLLGSDLRLTGQRTRLIQGDGGIIGAQNFGFDPASGVAEVELDPAIDRYTLEMVAQ